MFFSWLARKESKEASQRGATKMRPPLETPAASPFGVQKCSDFRTPTAENIGSFLLVDTRKSEYFRVSDGEAAGGFLRRAHFRSASLSRVLWLLSWRDKKVTLLHHDDRSI